MAIVTVGEMLERASEFEEQLTRHYATIRDECPDSGVHLLTYYLARHRRHQAEALKALDAATRGHLDQVELKFDVSSRLPSHFALADVPPAEINADQLINSAIDHDTVLIGLYRAVLEQPLSEEIQSVLRVLIDIEEQDMIMLKKMLAMHYF